MSSLRSPIFISAYIHFISVCIYCRQEACDSVFAWYHKGKFTNILVIYSFMWRLLGRHYDGQSTMPWCDYMLCIYKHSSRQNIILICMVNVFDHLYQTSKIDFECLQEAATEHAEHIHDPCFLAFCCSELLEVRHGHICTEWQNNSAVKWPTSQNCRITFLNKSCQNICLIMLSDLSLQWLL